MSRSLSLDAARREEVLPYLERLRDELAMPMIYVSHQFEEVLRLATHVVLLERAASLRRGSLDVVSLHPELRAIVGPEAVGAVLLGTVEGPDDGTGLIAVRVGASVLHVAQGAARVGAAVRVQLLARDIILATARPEGLSVRNMPDGHDRADRRVTIADTDLVYVDIGGPLILSRVTRVASRRSLAAGHERVGARKDSVDARTCVSCTAHPVDLRGRSSCTDRATARYQRMGSSRAFCTVRSAKLECTRATPGRRVRCLLCRRSKSAVSATTTRTT